MANGENEKKVNKEFIMGVVGAALRGFGKALKRKGKVYKTIKSVKPLSGKIPWYVSASNTAASRKSKYLKLI